MNILITSFGPFKNISENPSNQIMLEIKKSNDLQFLFPVKINYTTLKVSWRFIDRFVKSMSKQKYDLIIHLGVATNNTLMKIELNANNYFKGIDIFGEEAKYRIIPESINQLTTKLDINLINEIVNQNSNELVLSNNAGSYICNYLYFKSLEINFLISNVLFIHVADFFNQKDALSLEVQTHLFKKILLNLSNNNR
jgi:pyroglutamyl-peptidase